MRVPVRIAAGFVASALAVLAAPASLRAADTNLLLITIDTLRTDRLSCYDPGRGPTPRIDALAANGVLFERAFAHDPETLPSHTNILVGMTPLAHGVSENSKSVVAPEFLTLAELLKSKGYATAAFVSGYPLDSRFGLDQGFDVYDDRYPAKARTGERFSERPAEETVAAALPWLESANGKWFCWVHLWDPHDPYAPPEPFATRYADDPYTGEVAYVDAQLAILFGELDRKHLLDRTVVVLTGDHGEAFGEHGEVFHGYFAYNTTIHVPLIVSAPGLKAARIKDAVSHIDIFPTVCDLLGVEKPASLQGESLLPFLRGRTRKARPVYFEALEAYLNRGWAPVRGVIENGKKFIDSPIPELYDLEADFDESHNLAREPDIPAYQKRLREVMAAGASSLAALSGRATTDRQTRERLRSLGYAASRMTQLKSSYGPEDDLKTLLPLEQKSQQAERLKKQGRIPEAVRLLTDVLEARPDFAKAYEQLFQIYRGQGLIDDALGIYEKGAAANEKNFLFVSEFGIALVRNGRFRKGAEVLERSLALYDQDAEVWDSLGVAYGNMGDFEKAREDFDRALALAPEDAIINNNAGTLRVTMSVRSRDPEPARSALAYFEKAVAADPGLASTYNGLAGALRLLGRGDEAVANWEKAVELDPSFDKAIFNLAVAYLDKGDKAKALAACRKYLEVRGPSLTQDERREIESIIEKCKSPAGGGAA
jgi:arylsulfatase A-like enzyme/Tfp pilus assembly protein PilF